VEIYLHPFFIGNKGVVFEIEAIVFVLATDKKDLS